MGALIVVALLLAITGVIVWSTRRGRYCPGVKKAKVSPPQGDSRRKRADRKRRRLMRIIDGIARTHDTPQAW